MEPPFGFSEITQEEVHEAELRMRSEGVEGLSKFFREKQDQWRNIPLCIAITGESGVGKSSFINQIRGLTADDKGGAAVGTGDTTLEPTPYPHPTNDQIVFWDLPGVGTPKFSREDYSARVDLNKYNFFLLLSDDRFTTNDVWLAREIEKQKKNLFFVRTKIDDAMENAERTEGKRFRADDVIQRIKEDCEKNFKVAGLQNRPVYVISSYEPERWDYSRLLQDVLDTLPAQKRLAMVLSLGPISKEIIEEKTAFLKQRVWKTACMSALGSAVGSLAPIPVVGTAAALALDVGLLLKEVGFFLQQYGIDEDSLKQLSERTATPMDVYVSCLKSSSGVVLSGETLRSFILKRLEEVRAENEGKEGFKWVAPFLPIVGSVVSGAVSFGTCCECLQRIIGDFEKDALEVADKAIELTSTAV